MRHVAFFIVFIGLASIATAALPDERPQRDSISVFRADFGGSPDTSDCSTSTCLVYTRGNSWISGVAWTGAAAGDYTVTFTAGTFNSEVPICVCGAERSSSSTPLICGISSVGTSSLEDSNNGYG